MTDYNPFQFARIFETECGKQILVHVDTDSDDNPELIFSVYVGGDLGRCQIALGYSGEGTEEAVAKAYAALPKVTQSMAEGAYRQIIKSARPMMGDEWLAEHFREAPGMTFELADMARKDRREQIAMRCLQGMLASGKYHNAPMLAAAEDARCYADALMAELDKQDEPARDGKLCVGCNRTMPLDRFAEASPSHPTRDGRVYKCRDCVKEESDG